MTPRPAEYAELLARLEAAEETIRAIRAGEVDAIVTDGPEGPTIYTLKGADQAYRAMVETMSEGAVSVSPEGVILFCNERFAEIAGGRQEAIVGSSLPGLFAGDDRVKLADSLRATDRTPVRLEATLLASDGMAKPVSLAMRGQISEETRSVIIVVSDLTELKRALDAREFLARIVETSQDAIASWGPDRVVTSWNKGAERIFGYAAAEIVGRPIEILIPSDRMDEAATLIAGAAQGEETENQELMRVTKSGRRIWVSVSRSVVRDSTGRVLSFAAVGRDVTDRRLAEDALRDSEERFRMLIDEAPDAILIWESDNDHPVIANKAAERLFGVSREMILEGDPTRFFASSQPDDLPAERSHAEHLDRARAGEAITFLRRIRRPAGDERLCRATLVRLNAKRPLIRTSYVDITEQASAEAEVAMVRREMSVRQEDERLAIARELHDSLGQYLAAINLKLALLAKTGTDAGSLKSGLADLTNLTTAVGSEVSRLAWELRPISLDDIGLEAAFRRLGEEWTLRSGLAFDFHFAAGERRMPSDVETALYRVLQEAITNIVKHARAKKVGVILRASPHDVVMIVEDDGIGFDPEVARLTAPRRFGLLGMRERLTAIRGDLGIETAPGAGTTLIVRVALNMAAPV